MSIPGQHVTHPHGYLWEVGRQARHSIVVLDASGHARQRRRLWRAIYAAVDAVSAVRSVRRIRGTTSIAIITQFMTAALVFLWPAALYQTPIVLVVHHNFEQAKRSRLARLMLALTHHMGFIFLIFESDSALYDSRLRVLQNSARIVLPQLGPSEELRPKLEHRGANIPRVSVVGFARTEKHTQKTIELLAQIAPTLGFRLIVGTDRLEDLRIPLGAEIRDTTRMEDYVQTLADSDVVVVANDPARYVHRSSGVLTDAITCGALVLAPDCEVFAHQMNTPAVAGATYGNDNEIEMRLRELLAVPLNVRLKAIAAHREHRSPSHVAKQLDQQLDGLGL